MLLRSIFQARFKPELGYFSKVIPLAESFEADYPEWAKTENDDVQMVNYDRFEQLILSHRSLSLSREGIDAAPTETSISEVLERAISGLGIPRFTRLGFRQLIATPVEMNFESLTKVMRTKLYVESPVLNAAMPKTTSDLLYRIDAYEGNEKFHITIAPIAKNEIPGKLVNVRKSVHVDPKRRREIIEEAEKGYPEVAILFDIDVYWENEEIRIERATEFVSTSVKSIRRISTGVIDYLLKTSVKP